MSYLILDSLKDKVKLYEDAFEQRYGYRPSHHQKMDDRNTKRVLTELARSRKELKQLKERHRLSDPLDVEVAESRDPSGTTTSATFFTAERSSAPTVEQTVLEVQEVITALLQYWTSQVEASQRQDVLISNAILNESNLLLAIRDSFDINYFSAELYSRAVCVCGMLFIAFG